NGYRQYVLGVLGLRSAVTVNRGMAAQLLARLRADKAGSCGPLLYAIVIPVLDLLCHATAPAPWAVMVGRGARPAVAAYAEHPHTAARIAYVACHYSPALLRAGLAAAIADDNPGAALALALLAAYDADAAAAHAKVATEFPRMPPVPV